MGLAAHLGKLARQRYLRGALLRAPRGNDADHASERATADAARTELATTLTEPATSTAALVAAPLPPELLAGANDLTSSEDPGGFAGRMAEREFLHDIFPAEPVELVASQQVTTVPMFR